jgi:pyruvate formate lyase activating enzyme
MRIGGFQKTSLIDYPDKISAIIWTVNCNFRCPFCYNIDLVEGNVGIVSEDEIFSFLKKRKGLLEALVITGGEPFLQEDLAVFCEKVKKLEYLVKLDTNGTFPDRLKDLIDSKLVDYVAMDVKAPVDKYGDLVGGNVDVSKIKKSIEIIQQSSVDYEFRTTMVPGLLQLEDVVKIGEWLKGSKRFYLQQFKGDVPLVSSELENATMYTGEELYSVLEKVKPFFEFCDVRGV